MHRDDDGNMIILDDSLIQSANAYPLVPWNRFGVPGWEYKKGEKDTPWDSLVRAVGTKTDIGRLATDDRLVDNAARWQGTVPEGMLAERCAAQCWDYENNKPHGKPLLWELLQEVTGEGELIQTEHDRLVAEVAVASVVQWLQTNCGQGFLHLVTRTMEAEKKRLQPLVKDHQKLLAAMGELHPPPNLFEGDHDNSTAGKKPAQGRRRRGRKKNDRGSKKARSSVS